MRPCDDGGLTDSQRVDILGCGVDLVDAARALERVKGLIATGKGAQVVTFGAEMAMLAQHDPRYRAVVNAADLVIPDTVGIVWASRVLGQPLRERVPGIEFAERLCDAVPEPIYLLGGAGGVAIEAATALRARHPQARIVGTHHGFFTDAESSAVADAIEASGARIVFVALGVPRQEYWVSGQRSRLSCVCIGVGGAFDVWAGRVSRAPETMRRAGLEWLYRLAREPSRLGRQMALPAFALRVIAQRAGRRKVDRSSN